MRTDAAARRWADTWQRGWEALDTELVLILYAEEARLSTEPFRVPFEGRSGVREYVSRVFAEEESPRVWVAEPIVDGDRAAISWWASMREDGADVSYAGTSNLRFDGDGLVLEQWDAWNTVAERRDAPDGPGAWGPFARR
jgi:hypothetical protein